MPYRFNLPRASSEESFKYGETHTPSEMLDTFDSVVVAQPRLGKVSGRAVGLVELEGDGVATLRERIT